MTVKRGDVLTLTLARFTSAVFTATVTRVAKLPGSQTGLRWVWLRIHDSSGKPLAGAKPRRVAEKALPDLVAQAQALQTEGR